MGLVWLIDAGLREAMLFAAVGLLVGGLDDLAIDLLWLRARIAARFAPPPTLAALAAATKGAPPLRLAILVAAWREQYVIGPMLETALRGIRHRNYAIYVGCYPNDAETIAAVSAVAARDPRVRLVIGPRDGPTTKADNLNAVWRALRADDEARGGRTDAVVLHDAEDVIDPEELCVHDALLRRHAAVQTPVLALIDPNHRLVSGHYADEFAESHCKTLVVRAAFGRGLPLAGVGCAIRTEALAGLAAADETPFDAASLTEDYELGLRLGEMGLSATFARVTGSDGRVVSTRAFFPLTLTAAVRQKARWMTGIALAGWDRTGWTRGLALGDHWMRMRDRRAPLAMLVLAAAYLSLAAFALSWGWHRWTGTAAPAVGPQLALLLRVNAGLLVWRLVWRMTLTGRIYGWREGLAAVPRLVVANVIALLAARRALTRYLATLGGSPVRWDKTEHVFPADATLAGAP